MNQFRRFSPMFRSNSLWSASCIRMVGLAVAFLALIALIDLTLPVQSWASDRPQKEQGAQGKAAAKPKRNVWSSGNAQLTGQEENRVIAAAKKYMATGQTDGSIDPLYKKKYWSVRWALNRFYKQTVAKQYQEDFQAKRVRFEKYVSPYAVKEVGTKPKKGWPLVIAMHGGGGAPKRVNDQQWKHMQVYYHDQPQVEGYKYLALRAPNDTWNGFYDDYVYPLIENLIKQQIVLGEVDSNRIFLIGYSHGGYGAFAIGPKIPHRFAAIHSSAAAPTDGLISPRTLRNTRFTFMVGGKDTAYGRAERCQKFAKQIAELKSEYPGDYPVKFFFEPEYGHGGLPDKDMIGKMYSYQRRPAPNHVTWAMTDNVVKSFFWLGKDDPVKGSVIDAQIEDNVIQIATENCNRFSLFLDRRLVDPELPVVLKIAGKETKINYVPKFATLCKSLMQSGDIKMTFDCEVAVEMATESLSPTK